MDIYVVQPGDSIYSIADKHGIPVERLITDNGLVTPYTLTPGQAIVILHPTKTYIIQPGDNLATIADSNGVSIMQLIRNNPFLYNREYIYPGESLVISYGSNKDIQINGYAYGFINRDILRRTLPYLTYISVFNYQIAENANIITFRDDTDIIQIAKDYQTIPLLMFSVFSPRGELNLDIVYELLLNEELQDKLINELLQIIRSKGFMGVNFLISHITESNQHLYLNIFTKLSTALKNEGYIFMLTINPNLKKIDNTVSYEKLDYTSISNVTDMIIFLDSVWGINRQSPSPVSNILLIRSFIGYVTTIIPPEKILIGKPLIGYDWDLPFDPGLSYANSLSLDNTIALAYEQRAEINLDLESQTPYFNYAESRMGIPDNHIVWFIDARSIKALNDVIIDYNLAGSGIWNLSNYNQQLWSIINATFTIIKFPIP